MWRQYYALKSVFKSYNYLYLCRTLVICLIFLLEILLSRKLILSYLSSYIYIYIYTTQETTKSGNTTNAIHYSDVIASTMQSQNTSLTFVCSTVYSGADQRKHQSSTSLAFVWGIHWSPVNFPHKGPVTRKCLHLMTSSCEVVSMFNEMCTVRMHCSKVCGWKTVNFYNLIFRWSALIWVWAQAMRGGVTM